MTKIEKEEHLFVLLDFEAKKSFNLETKIREAFKEITREKPHITLTNLTIAKDTDSVKRFQLPPLKGVDCHFKSI